MFKIPYRSTPFESFDELLKYYYNNMINDREFKITYKDYDIFIEKHQEKVTKLKFFKGIVIKSKSGFYKDISGQRINIINFFDKNCIVYTNGYIQYNKDTKYNFIY
jgi:hypothetical protein